MTLVDVRALKRHFPLRRSGFTGPKRAVRAVDGVSFSVAAGETLGIVGESGCGKSTVARLLLKLDTPTEGQICFDGQDLGTLGGDGLAAYRRAVQAVFQDPFSSLSPRMRVGEILAEGLEVHRIGNAAERSESVRRHLDLVGLPEDSAERYPHEFSGGQRQRIAIAKALILSPKLIVLDEPISALDVSIRAQILNLLADLKRRFDVAYVFIAHDLPAIATLSDRIVVMYLGRVVESGPAEAVALSPKHPYTQMLFAAVLSPLDDVPAGPALEGPRGEPASPISPPSGCHFHPRCPRALPQCATIEPPTVTVDGVTVACHLFG